MSGQTVILGSVAITTGTNHTAVKEFAGYSIIGSVAGMVRFRQAAVGGAIILQATLPTGAPNTVIFPGKFSTPGGVYVELVSGTFTEGTLVSV